MNAAAPVRLESPSGLAVELCANGSIRWITCGDVCVNAFPGSELEGGPANLFLRRLGERIAWIPLLGPRSPARVALDASGFEATGDWQGLRFRVSLRLADATPAWFWHVALENAAGTPLRLDLVHAQDLALADRAAVRRNEYYLSQYLDHAPLTHPTQGAALAVRQNLTINARHPWALFGSLARATGFATDALQLHGLATRAGRAPVGLRAPSLPNERRQHEHSMAVIQDAPVELSPGERASRGFFGWLEPDHPDASSEADLRHVDRVLALPEARLPDARMAARREATAATLFSAAPRLAAEPLDDAALRAHFGSEHRAAEREDGRLLSFFAGTNAHVVLPDKERRSLRPHGQILRSGDRLVPDEASLTSTVWMGGVFHSMLTQGHVDRGRLLSTTRSYLGLFRAHGLRVFTELAGGWQLLDQPSAFEMTPSGARWIYRHAAGRLEVRSWLPVDRHEAWLGVRVLEGARCRFLVSLHVAVNGDDGTTALPVRFTRDPHGVEIHLLPDSELGSRFPEGGLRIDPARGTALEQVGGDEQLFLDGRSRGLPYLVLVTAASRDIGLRITGQLASPAPTGTPPTDVEECAAIDSDSADRFWSRMTGSLALDASACGEATRAVAQLGEILPWLAHDALVHALAPRGLEQYSGGAWGTRDVCQGPVELLLGLGQTEPVREILRRVYANQSPDGDWPQWFAFFERERSIRAADSHGDVVFWPLLALARYLKASDDATLLDEEIPFFDPRGDERAERATLAAHVERALDLAARRVIAGTRLAVYGNGDWNDAMQPSDRSLGQRLCSAWTVTLHHQSHAELAAALRQVGRTRLADGIDARLSGIREDFQRRLVVDGVVAGLAYFRGDGGVEPWLHPGDPEPGVDYSLLPMIHAILADLFTREQAHHHAELIRGHLLAADGARLFDRPLPYRGGLEHRFQRAETASFFGREIGLLYVHAHLRYAEAMARLGDADAFWLALRQSHPVGLREVVPSARLRQANCFTSSSDADFRDRAEALVRYDDVRSGRVAVEGGWRVYSSGAGIALRLVRECLLGLRLRRSALEVDPLLPRALDGLRARFELDGRPLEVVYHVGSRGHGPRSLALDGAPLAFERVASPYREGGAAIPMSALRGRLRERGSVLAVGLG